MRRKKSEAQRQRLFEQYGANLSLLAQIPGITIMPFLAGTILCPLCLSSFGQEDLAVTQALTLDHVPPEALGGRDSDTVLVCGACNHSVGSEIDAHLIRTVKATNFAKGLPGAELDGRLHMNKSEHVAVTYRISQTGAIEIDLATRRNDPGKVEQLRSVFHTADDSFQFTAEMRFHGGKVANSAIGLLRIAYLMLFRQFGYAAVVPPAMNAVRSQIANPGEQILPPNWSLPDHVAERFPLGVNVIRAPKALQSLAVVFELVSAGIRSKHAVLLPLAQSPGLDIYSALKPPTSFDANTTVRYTPIAEDPRFWNDRLRCVEVLMYG